MFQLLQLANVTHFFFSIVSKHIFIKDQLDQLIAWIVAVAGLLARTYQFLALKSHNEGTESTLTDEVTRKVIMALTYSLVFVSFLHFPTQIYNARQESQNKKKKEAEETKKESQANALKEEDIEKAALDEDEERKEAGSPPLSRHAASWRTDHEANMKRASALSNTRQLSPLREVNDSSRVSVLSTSRQKLLPASERQ